MQYKEQDIIHVATTYTKQDFESLYLALRKKENRLYSDEQVKHLPSISSDHPHYKEWASRKRSSYRLCNYLSASKNPPRILEVGCGNGWLTNKLAALPGTFVTGFDINQHELSQAKRVFGQRMNVHFTSGDPFSVNEPLQFYDVIVFAASIQYFRSLQKTIATSLSMLKEGGSIHIIDTHFYEPGEVAQARSRSSDYYASMGFPELNDYYFHHALTGLEQFRLRVLYDPTTWWNRLMHKNDPFHWVCIQKM